MKRTYWRLWVGPDGGNGVLFDCRMKMLGFIADSIARGYTTFSIDEVKMTPRQYKNLPEHSGL